MMALWWGGGGVFSSLTNLSADLEKDAASVIEIKQHCTPQL